MAILFFEGLPGAGKSYEAMATQIIPALQKGREVVVYIEGLNVDKIAAAAGLSADVVGRLLFPVTRDQMRPSTVKQGRKELSVDGEWLRHVRDNALHVFDEAQSWWGLRWKASEALTEFVSEHRHRGMDILLMGQSLKDVMPLWRRRVDQKFSFLKLTALGTAKRYRVTIYKGQGDDKFVKVTTRVGKYDAKYFGTYSSHTGDDINTATYTDGRVRLWGSWGFKFGVPLVLGLAVWGALTLRSFFHSVPVHQRPAVAMRSAPPVVPRGGAAAVLVASAVPIPALPVAKASAPDRRGLAERYFSDLSGKARIRLAGMVSAKGRVSGVVEWWDGSRVIERLDLPELQRLGAVVTVVGDEAVKLRFGDWQTLATAWPVVDSSEGKVSQRDQVRIAGGDTPDNPYTRQEVGSSAVDVDPPPAHLRPAGLLVHR
jgi:zona occludens toxin